jgi:hypothetical protein
VTQQHPITPSIELVKQWSDRWHSAKDNDFDVVLFVAIEAARWGADQELEACCEYLTRCAAWEPWEPEDIQEMRDLRRPKPPSLKAQALQAAQRFYANGHEDCNDEEVKDDFGIIRRALESLPD